MNIYIYIRVCIYIYVHNISFIGPAPFCIIQTIQLSMAPQAQASSAVDKAFG